MVVTDISRIIFVIGVLPGFLLMTISMFMNVYLFLQYYDYLKSKNALINFTGYLKKHFDTIEIPEIKQVYKRSRQLNYIGIRLILGSLLLDILMVIVAGFFK